MKTLNVFKSSVFSIKIGLYVDYRQFYKHEKTARRIILTVLCFGLFYFLNMSP